MSSFYDDVPLVEQYMSIHADQDWQSHWPEENSVYIFRGKTYNIDKQRTIMIWEKIGKPIGSKPRHPNVVIEV